jgi:hypothetical protein
MSGSILRFKDSVVADIEIDDDTAVFRFEPAMIVKSEGIPGVDPSTLWRQSATLTLSEEVEREGDLAEFPMTLTEGTLITVNGTTFADHCPIPLRTSGFVEIELKVAGESNLILRAERVRLELLDAPKYVKHLT